MDTINAPILLAQCKAYHSLDDIIKEIESILKIHSSKTHRLYISLPYTYIEPISQKFPDNQLKAGAEIFPHADKESFTHSIAGKMLETVRAQFVLVGTPQDRAFNTTENLKNKAKAVLENKIPLFICLNDTLQQFQDKTSSQTLLGQLKEITEGLSNDELKNAYIVYNAEWISSTPWEASSPELREAYSTFREVIKTAFEPGVINDAQLIVTIPAYSNDVSHIIAFLQKEQHPITGYSLGILGSSAEYLKPLFTDSSQMIDTIQSQTNETEREVEEEK